MSNSDGVSLQKCSRHCFNISELNWLGKSGPRVILIMREFASRTQKSRTCLGARQHAVCCACFTRKCSDHEGRFPT